MLKGEVFGFLTYTGNYKKTARHTLAEFTCQCGNRVELPMAKVRYGHTKSCGCFRLQYIYQKGDRGKAMVLKSYKKVAEERNLKWELEDQLALELMQECCHYCGSPPSNTASSGRTERARNHSTFVYSGLDRVDNATGYTISNVVPCCRTCNFMKQGLSYTHFIEKAASITRRRNA